jgi:regulator of sigma E protease
MATLLLILQIIGGLLILTFLVVIHELGHAIVARRNDVVVEEFGIGIPPRAWSKKLKNRIVFSLNWLPIGGFVKMQGESDDAHKKGDYGAASLWAKTKILLAGVGVNWLAAIIIFTGLALVGFPKVLSDQFHVASDTTTVVQPLQVSFVESHSPASGVGLKAGDTLVSFNNHTVSDPDQLMADTKNHKGQTVNLVYRHKGAIIHRQVHLRQNTGKDQGVLGVSTSSKTSYRSTWSAPIVGVGATIQFSVVTLQGLGSLIGNLSHGLSAQLSSSKSARTQGSQQIAAAGASVAGPVGLLGVIFPAAQAAGPVTLLLFVGIISLTLAVMNALPFPALDGGRLFVTLLFRLFKKPLNKSLEEKIHGAGFAILVLLILIITVADIFKITSGVYV